MFPPCRRCFTDARSLHPPYFSSGRVFPLSFFPQAEWAAYYAAQAAAGQGGGGAATATTTSAYTAAAAAPAPAAATGQQPAHDAYYEVFWQYAAYYGEDAARTVSCSVRSTSKQMPSRNIVSICSDRISLH